MNLTSKENEAFLHITQNAVQATSPESILYILDNNFSWFDNDDLSASNFTKNQLAGLISSLSEKRLIAKSDCWYMTELGIKTAASLFELDNGEVKRK